MPVRIRSNTNTRDMRVLVFFHRFGPYHVARLKAASQHLPITGVEFSAQTSEYAWDKAESGDLERITLFSSDANISRRQLQEKVFAHLTAQQPTAVVVNGWSEPGPLTVIQWCAQNRVPLVVMSESQEQDETRSKLKEWIKKRIVSLFGSALVGGTPHKDYLVKLGLPEERIFLGYDIVDNAYFATEAKTARCKESELREELKLTNNYFIASNRFIEKKNLPRLIKAYANYQNKVGEASWHLVLLGDGPAREQIMSQIRDLGIGKWVLTPGFKQYSQLPSYYGLAKAFIHASTVEQWGLVVNEAMACGLPVLVSNRCGCARDLVQNGKNGYTFDPFNVDELSQHMRQLSDPETDLGVMSRHSREIIAQWSPQRFGRAMKAAVEAAINAPRPEAGKKDILMLKALIRR